jgi:tetratricopeptide (TPR) repeat protein
MTRLRSSLSDRLTHPLAALLLIGLIAALIYSNTFSASFHFDDVPNITDNPKIKHLVNLLDFSGSRYVGFLTFALNYRFGGLSLFGFHLVNLLIHIANGLLVYGLVRLLLKSPRLLPSPALTPAAPAIALCTALLFVVHPIQTQAVTYIVQRFASLASLFYLSAVLCYLKWRLSPSLARSRFAWYAAAFLASLLAMKTKEITFTLPFMLLLVEFVGFGPPSRKQWIGLIPFFLTLPIIPLSRPGALGEGEAGLARGTMDISRWDYLITQFKVIVTYLQLLVFPVNQNLDYDYPAAHSLFEPPVILSFLFLTALLLTAVYLLFVSRRAAADPRLRLIGFGILWFFFTLSIESSLIPIRDVIFEHRLYLPSVGFWLAATAALFGFIHRWRIPVATGIAGLILLFSLAAYQRNRIWQDELSLWSDVVRKSPNKARTHLGLGAVYKEAGRQDEALQEYKTAVTLKPDYGEAHNNLGVIYKEQKKWSEAIQEYQAALAFKPDYAEAHNNLGVVYKETGRLKEAAREYQTALSIKPDYPHGYYNLGLLYHEMKKPADAAVAFEEAIRLQPDYTEAHNNLGNVYQELGRQEDAFQEYKTAIAIKPDYAEAHNNLGFLYKETGQLIDAIREYQTALSFKPDYAAARRNLGNAYKELGKLNEAIQEYQAALALDPNDAQTHNNLGVAFKDLGRHNDAVREYQAALSLNPNYTEAHNNLGIVYKRLGRFKEAIQEYRAALSLDPTYAEVHNNLGNVYQKMDRLNDASREYQNAITLKPNYTQAHFNLGLVYYEQRRLSDAVDSFKEAVRLKPDYAEAHNNLGDIYKEQGRFQEAVQEFQTALKLKPDLVEAYYNLGESYQHAGQIPEAIKAYEQALRIKPDYEKARQALNALHR